MEQEPQDNDQEASEAHAYAEKAVDAWSELFPDKELSVEMFKKHGCLSGWYKPDEGKPVEARLYQQTSRGPNTFSLIANIGNPMALLEISETLLSKGLNVTARAYNEGNTRFEEGEDIFNERVAEQRKKFNFAE